MWNREDPHVRQPEALTCFEVACNLLLSPSLGTTFFFKALQVVPDVCTDERKFPRAISTRSLLLSTSILVVSPTRVYMIVNLITFKLLSILGLCQRKDTFHCAFQRGTARKFTRQSTSFNLVGAQLALLRKCQHDYLRN